MNFSSKRQAHVKSEEMLGDAADTPMSIGTLPRGPIIPRYDATYITSTHPPAKYFPVGSRPKTQPIPDAVLLRGNEEVRKRNEAYKRMVHGNAPVTSEAQLATLSAKPTQRYPLSQGQPAPGPVSVAPSGMQARQGNANDFTGQNLSTPSNRIM